MLGSHSYIFETASQKTVTAMRMILSSFALLLCSLFLSCNAINKKGDLSETLTGNWLILYPEHRLKTNNEAAVYGRHQDSVVSLYALKLISLQEDGTFFEMDSLQKPPAKWMFAKDSVLRVQEGGKGFNPFTAAVKNVTNGTLQIIQYLSLEGEKIKVIWHLKKIADDEAASALFDPVYNSWRKKPAAPEPAASLKKRLMALLDYYSDYFTLVGREAAYFSPARVPLPFNYYQHGMGLMPLMPPAFQHLFYDSEDAKKAWSLLQQTIAGTGTVFPRGENFVMEYGLFLKRLGEAIRK